MENTKPNDLVFGHIAHYQHHLAEYDRVKALAEHTIGVEADILFMELQGIAMVLEAYESW